MDQITLEDLVEFQGVDCKIVQCIYWVGDNTEGGGSDGVTPAVVLRKHTIRDTIQTIFDQRVAYKNQGLLLQEAFKLIMNSTYGKTIIKDIKTTNEYIPNKLILEYLIRNTI